MKKFFAVTNMFTAASTLCLVGTLAALSFTQHQDNLDILGFRFPEEREGNFILNETKFDYCFDICPARRPLNIKTQNIQEFCKNNSVIGTEDFRMILVPLLAVVCIYSLVDGWLLYKDYTWAPTNKLLFRHFKESEEREVDKAVDNEVENQDIMPISDGYKC